MENLITRRKALGWGAASLAAPAFITTATTSAWAAKAPVLVELFTSQGCSSCPPADELAGELAKDPNIYIVSLNVDYWDYLGWRDTLAKPEYTQRQYAYAASRGDGRVYTPQMVVNGLDHAVGSSQTAVESKISEARQKPLQVPLKLTLTAKEIKVDIPASTIAEEATLWLMAIESRVEQKIIRGENSGTTIIYHNVVRNLVPATMWKGEAYHGTWMRDTVMTKNTNNCIAVLQTGKAGGVLGLAKV
jgi:hypothetical protein